MRRRRIRRRTEPRNPPNRIWEIEGGESWRREDDLRINRECREVDDGRSSWLNGETVDYQSRQAYGLLVIPRRRYLILGLSAAIIAAVGCVIMWREWTEPRHKGERLSVWLREFPSIERFRSYDVQDTDAMVAVKAIGVQAVPYLVADIEGLRRRGLLSRCLPGWRICLPYHQGDIDERIGKWERAMGALWLLGEHAAPALPTIKHWLEHGYIDEAGGRMLLSGMGKPGKQLLKERLDRAERGEAPAVPKLQGR